MSRLLNGPGFRPVEGRLGLAVGLLAGLASPLAAQAPDADAADACVGELVSYREHTAGENWLLDLPAPGGGWLLYFGALHSREPGHEQFARIETAWRRVRPTVAFYEGPARPVAATAEETIRRYGESGFVRFLAQETGARVERLEPPPQAEFEALRAQFPLEQIKLFYVLRETARLRERDGLAEAPLKAAVAQLLTRAQALFGDAFGDAWGLADLDAAYRRHWSEPAEWWQAPTRWFTPGDASSATGGIFTNDVNRASSEFRNRHMYQVLAHAARAGERVFAVVGRDHVPKQAAALRCALRGPV